MEDRAEYPWHGNAQGLVLVFMLVMEVKMLKKDWIKRMAINRGIPEDMPIVEATRTLDGDILVIKCPNCGNDHYHSGTPYIGHGDGSRVPHCDSDREYYIMELVEYSKIK